jgi:hypothetical protein
MASSIESQNPIEKTMYSPTVPEAPDFNPMALMHHGVTNDLFEANEQSGLPKGFPSLQIIASESSEPKKETVNVLGPEDMLKLREVLRKAMNPGWRRGS